MARPNPPAIEIARRLKQNYIVGMITDNSAYRAERLLLREGFYGLFDPVAVSCYVHSTKKQKGKKIFEEALKRAGLAAEECVFIDNSLPNLEVAREMGFATIHYQAGEHPPSRIIEGLAGLGVKTNKLF
ncbi:MAG: HAD-IA family hydrolase [Candidatus Diapherotrites archaeon]|nr:HAD-IA family hydrolase [Candidatus Diapherotrites archaeon]